MSYDAITTIGYEEIFGVAGDLTVEKLLSDIPSASIIEVVAHWTGQVHFNMADSKIQNGLLKPLIDRFSYPIIKAFQQAIRARQGKTIVFSSITSCYLYEIVFRNYNNLAIRSLTDGELLRIFMAYLILTDTWTIKPLAIVEEHPIPDDGVVEEIWKLMIPAWISYQEEIRPRDLRLGVIKSRKLFDFMEHHAQFALVVAEYFTQNQVESWRRYIDYVIRVYGPVNKKDGIYPTFFNIQTDDNYKKWLRSISVIPAEVQGSDDFTHLRQKPIFNYSESEFIILNPNFLLDKLYIGLIFELGHSKKAQELFGGFDDFRSVLSDKFTEKHLFASAVKEAHKQSRVSYTGDELVTMQKEIQPDFYARRYQTLFLYEFKDVIINARVKHSYDFESVESEVYKKVIRSDEGQKKGISQLVSAIELMKPEGYSFDIFKSRKTHVFPILVVSDGFFNAPTMNNWLNKKFWDLLKDVSYQCHVHDLTIIDLDTLIICKSLFSENRLNLADECQAYSQHTRTIYNTMDSFAVYIKDRIEKLGMKSKYNEEFAEAMKDVLQGRN